MTEDKQTLLKTILNSDTKICKGTTGYKSWYHNNIYQVYVSFPMEYIQYCTVLSMMIIEKNRNSLELWYSF